jgi:hypothetical protein
MKLKYSSGWFAAGREVRLAATVLSDSAFKLFIWMCLHAERNSGRLQLVIADLARSLRKTEDDIGVAVDELVRAGICRLRAPNSIEIEESFWPYRRDRGESDLDHPVAYVAAIRRLFLRPACVSSSFSAADQRLALAWRARGVSFERAERAIYLGLARKYAALLNHGNGSPITALSYFENLLDEVDRADVSPQYWQHVKQRADQFERRWRTLKTTTTHKSPPHPETK